MPRVPPQEKTMSACPLRRLRSSEMTLHCNGMNLKDEIQSPCKENNIKSQSQLPRLVQIGHPSPGEDTLIASALSPKRKPRLALSPRKRMGDENGCNVDVSLQGSPPKRNNPAPCTLSSSRKLGFDENSLQSPTRGLVSVLLKQPSSPSGRLFNNRSKETLDGNSSCQQLEKKSQAFCLFAEKSRFQNVKQALHTAVPERLLSREKECKSIRSFLDKRVLQRNPASLYISGPPGTGKTACLNHVLQEMKDELMPIQIVEVNCMTLRNSHAIFPTLADKLGICGSHTEAKLQKILTTTGPTVLLVLDEMDQLDSKDHDVLYTIFEWPYLPKSRLCLIGIANALDLTDRILPRLQALPQCHPQLLNFSPYSRQELTSIVQDRLKRVSGEKLLDTSAIQFCARKVSAVSGDARKALDICRRAVEMVESNDRKEMPGSTAGTKVSTCGVPQVARVLSEVYGNCMTTSVNGEEESIPLQQKLLVCCLLLLTYNGKTKEMSLGKLHEVYSRLCDQRQVASVGQGECLSLCSLLESRGIFGLKKAKEARLTKISLKIEERDVESALKDRALLGSMLAAGLP